MLIELKNSEFAMNGSTNLSKGGKLSNYITKIYSLSLIICGDLIEKNPSVFLAVENIAQMISFASSSFLTKLSTEYLEINLKNFYVHFARQMYNDSDDNKKFFCSIIAPIILEILSKIVLIVEECSKYDEEEYFKITLNFLV